MAITAKVAFLLAFAFVFVIVFFIGLAVVTPFDWILSLLGISGNGLYLAVAVAALSIGLIFGFIGLLMFYAWRTLPRSIQVVLILGVLAFGLALAQPEIDAVALVGAILTLGGVNNGQKAIGARSR